ncbi:hypothetical protein BJX61DRAFT_541736 [Aspergillus egyptiacus]|nr:hypothetical protein BJX61DRAFT_541736 [Aspergillus egyptiacus]
MIVDAARFEFSLVDHNGQSVREAEYYTKYTIVFFGFTNCKRVCPRNLQRLTDALNALGHDADRINPLYISVDPERDTPSTMKRFLSTHAPAFTGLTGTVEQVGAAKKALRVFAHRKEDADAPDGYTVPHTAFTYILGPGGRFLDHLSDALGVQDVIARIRNALGRTLDQTNSAEQSGTAADLTTPLQDPVPQENLVLLDAKQVASIRHIGNLARQLKGDWSNMMGPSHLNDGFGAYQFQLSYAAYALALAHFHRLPAAPGLFKPTLERLIQKLCEPDCWFYWRDASTGGGAFKTPRGEPNANPVEKDNIMYSAYLQTLVLLYNILFDDDRYTKPGALTLEYDPYFWGEAGEFHFEYDQNSLNDRVYWNMVESGYLGVPCEPWDTAGEVTQGYLNAWEEYGGSIDGNGDYRLLVAKHIQQVIPSPGPGMDAWCATLMHAWNSDFVNAHYEAQRAKWLVRYDDGTLSVKITPPREPSDNVSALLQPGELGWVAALAAEMGDTDTLRGLLAYADQNLSPRIQNGGLTYARCDTFLDDRGNYVLSSPLQANALFPLARLNVPNGLQRLYAQPWSPKNSQHYKEPALTDVDFAIDMYRAVYIADRQTLLFDVSVYEANARGSIVLSRVFGRGDWTLKRNGAQVARGDRARLLASEAPAEIHQESEALRLAVSETTVTSYVVEWFG